jgi:hypothetical protein
MRNRRKGIHGEFSLALFRWRYRPLFRGTLIANFGFDLKSANELVQSGVQIPCRRKALTFRQINTKDAFSNGNGPFGCFFVPLGEEEQRFT